VQALHDTLDFTCSGDKPGGWNRQVVLARATGGERGRGFVAAHRPYSRSETGLLIGLELERQLQALGGLAVRMGGPPLQLLDAVLAQTRTLGEPFLCQSGRKPVLPQELSERR